MHIQPYLFFGGRCEEALAFYRQSLGAEVTMMMRYKDSPAPPSPATMPPGSEDKVMHAAFRVGANLMMASDGDCAGTTSFQGFGLALNAADAAEAQRLYAALSDGGEVRMPMQATFFSPAFGMVADRFGVMWMVMAPA